MKNLRLYKGMLWLIILLSAESLLSDLILLFLSMLDSSGTWMYYMIESVPKLFLVIGICLIFGLGKSNSVCLGRTISLASLAAVINILSLKFISLLEILNCDINAFLIARNKYFDFLSEQSRLNNTYLIFNYIWFLIPLVFLRKQEIKPND